MKFKPTMYMKDIYSVDFDKVYNMGYRVLFIDLDNTLVAHDVKEPTEQVFELIHNLKSIGFTIIILSNNKKNRVNNFVKDLNVISLYSARKPLGFKYKRLINKYSFNKSEILCIGDQIMTDVYGANKLKISNMLVDPLAKKDIIFTKLNRMMEKRVYKKLEKKGLLIRGQYYYE